MPGYPRRQPLAPSTSDPRRLIPLALRNQDSRRWLGLIGGGIGAAVVAVADNNSSNGGLIFNGTAAPAAHVDGSITEAAAKIGPRVV